MPSALALSGLTPFSLNRSQPLRGESTDRGGTFVPPGYRGASYLLQLLPLMLVQVGPGWWATVGENELGPPGVTAFSVGVDTGDDGVVVVDGASCSLLVQPDVRAPIPIIATPPAKTAIRRVKRSELMACPVCDEAGSPAPPKLGYDT